jgi:hypothetical protein
MTTVEITDLTPEVQIESILRYLIRINGVEIALVDSEREAIAVIDSLGAYEAKKLESPSVRVFRQDLDNNKKIKISTQSLGILVNGSIIKKFSIDYVPVPHAILTKQRIPTPKDHINGVNSSKVNLLEVEANCGEEYNPDQKEN